MKPELYRNIKYTGATLLVLLLLSGADCELIPKCNNGPANAVRTLAGTDASINKVRGGDNNTSALTIGTPDPYLRWKNGSTVGNHSISCFSDYWKNNYGDDELQAVVWIGSDKPLCATISSLTYTYDGAAGKLIVTAVLKRPDQFHPALSGSGDVVININQSCNPSLPCQGITDLTANCYQPFVSPGADNSQFTAYAAGATLNYASFANVWMPNSTLSDTALSNASFAGANLSGVNLDNALMVYTDFTDADMTDAHAYGSRVYQAIAPNGTVVNTYQALLENQVGVIPPSSTTTAIEPVASTTSTTSTNTTTSTTTIGTTTSSI